MFAMLNYRYITLNSGYKIPQFGLGVFKSELGAETSNAVKWALEADYRHIDTAMMYHNEADVARGIKESGVKREDIFITSKLAVDSVLNKKAVEGIKSSLKALDTDYIDLYLIHWPATNFTEAWKIMNEYRDNGILRSIGVSNFQIRHLERIEKLGLSVPAVNQIELHPSFQQHELTAYCKERGIEIEAWSPLGGSDHSLIGNPVIQQIANKHGKTGAQVIIRWHVQKGNIVIPKSVKKERIEENSDVFDFILDDNDMEAIAGMDTGVRSYWDPDRWE